MDDLEESVSPQPRPSKIPSWVMLGFILGALCVWALPHPKETAPPPAPVTEIKATSVATHPRQSDVEALFAKWSRYAMWTDDITYVCMFNIETKTFRDCFEILRHGDNLYFRTIDRPRNLRALEGVPDDSPLEFLNPVPVPRSFWERSRVTLPSSAPAESPVLAPFPPPSAPENVPVEINRPKP